MSSEAADQQAQLLIHGYLDDQLNAEQLLQLQTLLLQSPPLADQFAQQHLLHDRLRNPGLLSAAVPTGQLAAPHRSVVATQPNARSRRRRLRRSLTLAGILLISLSATLLFWSGLAGTPASAASAELQRLLTASSRQADRTWQLSIEETAAPVARRRRSQPSTTTDARRPPKVSLDNARLYVRSGGQFVLARQMPDGSSFLTGSDGAESWAIRPDQSVRVSRDPAHFSRDIPGHEHSMSFVHIDQLLTQLNHYYHIQVLPHVTAADSEELSEPADRLLIAVRRQKVPGPGRVEISYDPLNGSIHQLRFVDMPYGPDRLTLRMTLISEASLEPQFFKHSNHHPPDRRIEQE
jgi:hypothetical protein